MKILLESQQTDRLTIETGPGNRIIISSCFPLDETAFRLSPWGKRLLEVMSMPEDELLGLLGEVANQMNFQFSLIIQIGESIYLAADIIRSYPLFYGNYGEEPFVTDHLESYFKVHVAPEMDPDRMEEFVVFGYVPGRGTIYRGISGLQAAEVVRISQGKTDTLRYYDHVPRQTPLKYKDLEEFTAIFDRALRKVIHRMTGHAHGVNNWVVPLSGGHDSRMIVNYFLKMGIQNVICFSYGIPGNEQSKISKQVAEAGGFPWHFVEYTSEKWLELHRLKIFDDIIHNAFNGTSTPHFQDALAVYEMKKQGILKAGDVIVPGHGLDINTGYWLDKSELSCNNTDKAVKRAYKGQCRLITRSSVALQAVRSIFAQGHAGTQAFREYLNWQENQVKFIINSIRVYETLGFRSRIPFWDREIVDLCLSIPPPDRMGRGIIIKAEKQGLLADPLRMIPFAAEVNAVNELKFKHFIKKMVPYWFLVWLLRLTGHRATVAEGTHHIYSQKADSVEELLTPVSDYPVQVLNYFRNFLKRYPFQMDPHLLTSFYTIRKVLDRN